MSYNHQWLIYAILDEIVILGSLLKGLDNSGWSWESLKPVPAHKEERVLRNTTSRA